MLCSSLASHDGVLNADKTIKNDAAKSILKVRIGDKVEITEAAFVRLCEADIEKKFG
jgi:hypothetical protein